MDKQDRRTAKARWHERKVDWAIVAVRIGARAWLKLTPDPVALENRIRFMLRQGGGPTRDMQTAWDAVQAVTIEVVEWLDAELTDLARDRVGEARLAHWAETLDAGVF